MDDRTVLESILNRVQEWIRSADQKISIFFAFQGIIIALMTSNIFYQPRDISTKTQVLSTIFIGWAILLLLYGALKSLLSLLPHLKHKDPNLSLTYFGDISKHSLSEYKTSLGKMNDKEYSDEITRQIHICSIIATKKHEHFHDSLIVSSIGVAFFILSVLTFLYGK